MQKLTILVVLALIAFVFSGAVAFTATEQASILAAHNAERALTKVPPSATALPRLAWNAALAKTALNYAAKCTFAHNPNRATTGFTSVGENLWASTGLYTSSMARSAVASWNAEKSKYTYSPISAAAVATTGHYTQVIWEKTTQLGCAYAKCNSLVNFSPGKTIIVCNYGNAGNFIGQYPYVKRAGTVLEVEDDETLATEEY